MASVLSYLRELNIVTMMLRILLAVLCGGLIGLERERKNRPAGFRTYMLTALGATLTVLLSLQLDQMLHGPWRALAESIGATQDVSRFGAEAAKGIGFLGAGTILVTKSHEIKGLTTAAGLWAVSIIGTAIGAGFYTGGTVCYAFILLAMNVLRLVDVRIQSRQKTATVYFELRSKLSIGQLVRLAREKDCTLSELELYADSGYGDNLVCGTFTLWAEGRTSLDDILRELSAVEGVIYLTRI